MLDGGRSLCKCCILWYLQDIQLSEEIKGRWMGILHGLMLGPSPGAKTAGNHTMGGSVDAGHGSIIHYTADVSCSWKE